MDILNLIREPWPWYVAGPLIGLVTGALLLAGIAPLYADFYDQPEVRTILWALVAPFFFGAFFFDAFFGMVHLAPSSRRQDITGAGS